MRQDGERGVLVSILKAGNASTIDVVDGIRAMLPRVAQTLPPELQIQPLADQSIFVRAAVTGVIREAVIAAGLTALMILLFLGSWRSTLIIAVSIPLSILTSVMVLSFLGETINIMTLGGLALAVGILVDDATVTIENIERYLEEGQPLRDAILDGAAQIAVPALVSTLCICIVFVPMFLLERRRALSVRAAGRSGGVRDARLLRPVAHAGADAGDVSAAQPRSMKVAAARRAIRWFVPARLRSAASSGCAVPITAPDHASCSGRSCSSRSSWLCCLAVFALAPWLGQDFFPNTDSGQFILHLRAKTGTRIEETARLADLVEDSIRQIIPASELDTISTISACRTAPST